MIVRRHSWFSTLGSLVIGIAIAVPAVGANWQPEQPPPGDDHRDQPMAGPRRRPGGRPGEPGRRPIRDRIMEPRGPRPGEDPPMPPQEMVDWAMDVMKTKLPAVHERLSKLRQENPQRFERVFRKLMPFLREYRGLQERRPELAETVLEEFKAEERLRELSQEFQTAKEDGGRQIALSQEMDQLIRKQFELRQKRFEARLEDFEDRIKDQQLHLQMMKDRLQTTTNRKEELVSRRLSQVKAGRMTEGFPEMGPGMGGPGPGGPHPPPPGGEFGGPPGRPPPPEDGGPPPPEDGRPPPPDDDGGGPPPNPEE